MINLKNISKVIKNIFFNFLFYNFKIDYNGPKKFDLVFYF